MNAQHADMDKLTAALHVLREQLVYEVNAETIGTASMTPLKAMVAREALLWRLVELTEATINCVDAGNGLSAVILARASIECTAVQHQLNRAIISSKGMRPDDIDKKITRLLMGTRTFSTGNAVEDATVQIASR